MIYQELLKLHQRVQNLVKENNISWKTKYELIFSSNISTKIFFCFKELGVSFHYYDPDTSYEEDVKAFAYALRDKMQELQYAFPENY